jgi:topoisomerase IA-like protein
MTGTQIAGADGRVYQVVLGSGSATKMLAAAKKGTAKKTTKKGTAKKSTTKKSSSSKAAAKGVSQRNDVKNKSSMRAR